MSKQHSELVDAIRAGLDWPGDHGEGEYHTVMEAAEDALDGLVEQLDAVGDEAQAAHHRAEIAEIALEELREELGAQRKALRGLLFAAEKADVYPHKRAIVAQYETAKENAHRALSNPANELKPGEEIRWSWPPGYSGSVAPEQSPANVPEPDWDEVTEQYQRDTGAEPVPASVPES